PGVGHTLFHADANQWRLPVAGFASRPVSPQGLGRRKTRLRKTGGPCVRPAVACGFRYEITTVMKASSIVLAVVVFAADGQGQQWLDALDDKLSLKSQNGTFSAQLSGLLDLEGYYVDQRPPGLLFEDESFFNPRLTLFLDAKLGPHFYAFVQARFDRGFDPG